MPSPNKSAEYSRTIGKHRNSVYGVPCYFASGGRNDLFPEEFRECIATHDFCPVFRAQNRVKRGDKRRIQVKKVTVLLAVAVPVIVVLFTTVNPPSVMAVP